MAKRYTVDERSAQRIARTVRTVEAMRRRGLTQPDPTLIHTQLSLASMIRRFELKTALTAGGSAEAYWITWNSQTEEWDRLQGERYGSGYITETLYDPFEYFTGTAADDEEETRGSYGIAYKSFDVDRWEIAWIKPQIIGPETIRFQAAEDCDTQIAFDVDNVSVKLPVGAEFKEGGEGQWAQPTTVFNFHTHDVRDDKWGEAFWNEDDQRWDAIQVDCPA